MCPYWIILLAFCQGVLCAEVCTSTVAGVTLTVTCTGNKYCCENDANCCSKLSTGVIIAFAVGGAVFLSLIIGLIIYAIVKEKKKKSHVTPVHPGDSSMHDQPPPYTPRVVANHPPPGAPPRYNAYASGSIGGTGYAPTQQSERKIPL